MEIPRFHPNDRPTLGVEIELQLVDAQTMALTSAFDAVLAGVPEPFREKVKPELMQCYLELNTEVCRTVADVERDLKEKILIVEEAAQRVGVKLLWSATHPFSPWYEQQITPKERYLGLVELLQETARGWSSSACTCMSDSTRATRRS